MLAQGFSGLLHDVPGFWNFAISALGMIVSAVAVVWVSINRTRRGLAAVRAKYAARMYELKTERQKMLISSRDRRELKRATAKLAEMRSPANNGERVRRLRRPKRDRARHEPQAGETENRAS